MVYDKKSYVLSPHIHTHVLCVTAPNCTMLFPPFYRGGCAHIMNCAQIRTSKELCQQSWMSLILEPFGPMTIPILESSPVHESGVKARRLQRCRTATCCNASEHFDRTKKLHANQIIYNNLRYIVYTQCIQRQKRLGKVQPPWVVPWVIQGTCSPAP